jgi:deoxyribonuclease-1
VVIIKDAAELVKAYEANIRLHAGHAHPYQRQAALGSSGAAPVTDSANGEVHGNKHSKIYHLSSCPGYTGMNPASIVTFPSEAKAQQAGYRKAKNCP